MRKFSSKYMTASGDVVDGRTRVYAVILAGDSTMDLQSSIALPAIELKNGSASGDVLLSVNDCANSADGALYSGTVILDLPEGGVLFTDGVYLSAYPAGQTAGGFYGACIFFEGGAAA